MNYINSTSNGSNLTQWNLQFELALKELRDNPEQDNYLLEELFTKVGSECNKNDYSLVIDIDLNKLSEDQLGQLGKWGIVLKGKNSKQISLNPPLKESTGTHGSGERQKMIESVVTASLDWDHEDDIIVKINLFGKFTGLYHKLVNLLTIKLYPNQIKSINVIDNSDWRNELAGYSDSIIALPETKKWPNFVKNQVQELIETLEIVK